MNSKAIIFFLFIVLATLLASPVMGEECSTQYGGYEEKCVPSDLALNKQVRNPISDLFVENLGSTDATFSPGSEITYKLRITNNSGETFSTVTVKDYFPEHLEYISGPGEYRDDIRELKFELSDMVAGESREVEITARVKGADQLPDQSLFCMTNRASAEARGRHDEDTAEACVTTSVDGVSTLPVAGFNDALLMVPFISLGGAGIALLKKKGA